MTKPLVQSLRLDGLLSFAPGSPAIELRALNVLIGPNGSGKSNLIEAFELLRATPTAFASAIRDGGGASEWIWKGDPVCKTAALEVQVHHPGLGRNLRYRLAFSSVGQRVEVVDELLEESAVAKPGASDVFFYYRLQGGKPAINVTGSGTPQKRRLERDTLSLGESVLSQRKDPDAYPELTWVGQQFGNLQTIREWSFGRYAPLRQPQAADLPSDILLPGARNLALVLNELEHQGRSKELFGHLSRFFPRFDRLSTRVLGGTIQLYLHEAGFSAPIPATRLSDGTLRFLTLLAVLLAPSSGSVVCIEEPELGLHPDTLSMLAELLVEASSRMQLVVTTHSDALVSALSEHAESVLVCERIGAGTRLSRVDSSKLQHWLSDYRLGDIWRIGELGGNP
jgi:predicted ATPase